MTAPYTREPARGLAGKLHAAQGDALLHPVRAFSASDPELTVAEGVVVAVADFPTWVIRTTDGSNVHWAAHLCEITGEPVADVPEPAQDSSPLTLLAAALNAAGIDSKASTPDYALVAKLADTWQGRRLLDLANLGHSAERAANEVTS